jgi:hypothetical protein
MSTTSGTPAGGHSGGLPNFMLLPAELREVIYFYALNPPFPPIETHAINNTTNRVRIPSIAQLSRATRNEALAVFYRRREVIISLHCQRNVDRALAWAKAWGDSAHLSDSITISGTMRTCSNDFYQLKIKCSRDEPQFSVEVRQHPRERSNRLCQIMRSALAKHLETLAKEKQQDNQRGKLTSRDLLGVLTLVGQLSRREVPEDSIQEGVETSRLSKLRIS